MAQNECTPALMELRDWLKMQVEDELKAFKDYSESGKKFAGFPVEAKEGSIGWTVQSFATQLKLIAGQELDHKLVLEKMVDYITEKCEPAKVREIIPVETLRPGHKT